MALDREVGDADAAVLNRVGDRASLRVIHASSRFCSLTKPLGHQYELVFAQKCPIAFAPNSEH
jgi:hypothetical protein